MTDPVWIHEAGTPLAAERACELLRAEGIKCNYLELPFQRRVSFLPSVPSDNRWYVFVAQADAERGAAVLANGSSMVEESP